MAKVSKGTDVIRIKPYFYIHILDNNTNCTRVEVGPQTYTRKDHEQIIEGPVPMIIIPPRHYARIQNPVVRDDAGNPKLDENGQAILRYGDEEIRTNKNPFPLYPGEKLSNRVQGLQVVPAESALRIRCIRDFEDRRAGDEYLFKGPNTYMPKVEEQVVEVINSTVVKPNEALKLRARLDTVDSEGNERAAGEVWLYRKTGAFLPSVYEEIVETVRAIVLTEKKALHLRATQTFVDSFGKTRKAGTEWLVTIDQAETHIPDVYEEVVNSEVRIITLNNRQYAVVLAPCDENGIPQLGKKELRKGPCSFFLKPGESLESGIQNVEVLGGDEALLLRSRQEYEDTEEGVARKPGERWLIKGPCDFIPDIQVEIVERRRYIPLDENEGIYVRDLLTGKVRSIMGESYLLSENEVLWEKPLPSVVEELLHKASSEGAARDKQYGKKYPGPDRDKTRVVTYRAPHGSAVQVYDYKEKRSRIVFGPELVMLGPDEMFTVVNLSGDVPKRPGLIQSLCLYLGPDFMTDIVTVETADHARLSLKLSYNWHFEVEGLSNEEASVIFQVPDFVGDACKAIASRVRGAVASVSFDAFHKNSSNIIRTAVFGVDPETEEVRNKFFFHNNHLTITNIDIQSVEPVDQRTRDALQKSVQLAIEITTKSQEAAARHEAEREEQEARGRLERQKINDEAEAEKARKSLLSLQAASAAVEATGQATAEARARAEAALIEGQAAVEQARLKAESAKIKALAELDQKTKKQVQEVVHKTKFVELELAKAKELAEIESKKFEDTVNAIGATTIQSIARAGPEMQARLLKGLGLKSFMITDGHSPINLFNTASGMIGAKPN
jgi:major vault protein